MTTFESFTLFATMAILAAIPSASVVLVIVRSITKGPLHGIAVGAGILAGDLLFIGLVMLGLTVIAEAMGGMFIFVKILGGSYLLWLGVSLLRSRTNDSQAKELPDQKGSFIASFSSGLLLTLGDIKAVFFYLSLLPLFIDMAALRAADALLVVAITIVAVGGVKVLYAVSAHRLVSSIGGERFTGLSTKAAGATLIAAGGYFIAKV